MKWATLTVGLAALVLLGCPPPARCATVGDVDWDCRAWLQEPDASADPAANSRCSVYVAVLRDLQEWDRAPHEAIRFCLPKDDLEVVRAIHAYAAQDYLNAREPFGKLARDIAPKLFQCRRAVSGIVLGPAR